MDGLREGLAKLDAQRASGSVLSFVPDIGSAWMPLLTFFVYIAVTWWATWYPGAEPGGGGYVAQRMFSAKDERHSLLATLWFAIAHYALRPWPWILAALASLVLYPHLADKETGYIQLIVDPNVFPPALRGLMVAAFAAAYMSTVATQLNWGASYLINDLYKRFWVKQAGERHYIRASQVATLLLMVASCVVTYFQTSVVGGLEAAAGDRRRHRQRPDPALVLVAPQRLERGLGHGRQPGGLAVPAVGAEAEPVRPAAVRHPGADHGGGLDRHLAGGHLPDQAGAGRGAAELLPAGAPQRRLLGADRAQGHRRAARCATAAPTSSTGSPAA